MTTQDLLHIGVDAQPDPAEQTPREPAEAQDPIVDQQREDELGARKAGGAQQGVISRPGRRC